MSKVPLDGIDYHTDRLSLPTREAFGCVQVVDRMKQLAVRVVRRKA